MYCRAHKSATLTPIQHTVEGAKAPQTPPLTRALGCGKPRWQNLVAVVIISQINQARWVLLLLS